MNDCCVTSGSLLVSLTLAATFLNKKKKKQKYRDYSLDSMQTTYLPWTLKYFNNYLYLTRLHGVI